LSIVTAGYVTAVAPVPVDVSGNTMRVPLASLMPRFVPATVAVADVATRLT
jgi:hypothetical protein